MATIQEAIELRTAGQPEEAKEILLGLLAQSPDDSEILYQLAWVHDLMGLEGEAVPYYEKAISSGLKDPERCGALLDLKHLSYVGDVRQIQGDFGAGLAGISRGEGV